MKILDEKGKLFGKVNLIDLIVVLVILAGVAAVAWKLGGSAVSEAINSNATTLRYEVVCTNVNPEAAEGAVADIGGQLMSNGDLLDGHITDCVIEPHMETVLDSDGNPKQVEDPSVRDLRFTIETKVSLAANAYAVGSQEVRVGKSHIVKTVDIEFNGTVTAVEIVE